MLECIGWNIIELSYTNIWFSVAHIIRHQPTLTALQPPCESRRYQCIWYIVLHEQNTKIDLINKTHHSNVTLNDMFVVGECPKRCIFNYQNV